MDSVSLSHHTVVEIAAKIHEPSMQFPQYNCRALYPRVSSLYETDDWKSQSWNFWTTGSEQRKRNFAYAFFPELKSTSLWTLAGYRIHVGLTPNIC
jgi:hypothetical protein